MINYFDSKSYQKKQALRESNKQLRNSKEFENKINNTPLYDQLNGFSEHTWNIENRLYAFDKILSKENLDLDTKKYIINELGKSIKRKNDFELNSEYNQLINKHISEDELAQKYDSIFNKKENLEQKTNIIEQKNPFKEWGYQFKRVASYLTALGILGLYTTGCKDDYNIEKAKKDTKEIIQKIYSPQEKKSENIEKLEKGFKYIEVPKQKEQLNSVKVEIVQPKIESKQIKITKPKEQSKIKPNLPKATQPILTDITRQAATEVYKIHILNNEENSKPVLFVEGQTKEARNKIKESIATGYGILQDLAKDYGINTPIIAPGKATISTDSNTGITTVIAKTDASKKDITQIIEQNFKNLGKDIKSYYKDNREFYPGGNPKKTISTKDSFKAFIGNIKGFFDNSLGNGSDIRSEKENEVYKNASIGGADILGITTQPAYEGIKQNLIGGGDTKKTIKEGAKSGLDKISKGVIKTWIDNLNPLNKDEFILLHPIKTAADALITIPNAIVGAAEIITSPIQAIPKTDINGILNNIYDIPKHSLKNAIGEIPSTTIELTKTILKAPASIGNLNRETKYHKIINEVIAPIKAIQTALARSNPAVKVHDSFLNVGGSNIDNLIKNIESKLDKESYLYNALGRMNTTPISIISNKTLEDYMQDKDNGSLFFLLPKKKHEKEVEIITPQKPEEPQPEPTPESGHGGGHHDEDNGNDNPPQPPQPPQPEPPQFENNEENDPVDPDGDGNYDYKPNDYNW